MTSAYPLAWPEGWPRGQKLPKGAGRFITTYDRTMSRLKGVLGRLKATHFVISSNIPLRQDGMPRADVARFRVGDAGVAVYFTRGGKQLVLARDAYETVYDNLHSLTLALEHLSLLERHGGAAMMERAFDGFAALPEPGNASHLAPWWKVLAFEADPSAASIPLFGRRTLLEAAESAYRRLARERHPDRPGGSHDAMAELNAAIERARKELGS